MTGIMLNLLARKVGVAVQYLVLAGGGAGAGGIGGGGGAGGYRSSALGELSGGGASAETPLSIALNTNYQVTIGAGGTRGATENTPGTNGGSSTLQPLRVMVVDAVVLLQQEQRAKRQPQTSPAQAAVERETALLLVLQQPAKVLQVALV